MDHYLDTLNLARALSEGRLTHDPARRFARPAQLLSQVDRKKPTPPRRQVIPYDEQLPRAIRALSAAQAHAGSGTFMSRLLRAQIREAITAA